MMSLKRVYNLHNNYWGMGMDRTVLDTNLTAIYDAENNAVVFMDEEGNGTVILLNRECKGNLYVRFPKNYIKYFK